MITIRYFARLRERVNMESEELTSDPETNDVASVIRLLTVRGGVWAELFDQQAQPVLVAVNQEMATGDTTLNDGDEVAFFPPVTGG